MIEDTDISLANEDKACRLVNQELRRIAKTIAKGDVLIFYCMIVDVQHGARRISLLPGFESVPESIVEELKELTCKSLDDAIQNGGSNISGNEMLHW